MEIFLERSTPGDWVMLVDDDNPPHSGTTIADTWRFARDCVAADPATAAVGGAGARYSRKSGTFERITDGELHGRVSVDYIGSGQFPMYSREAVSGVGIFDQSLFFGFDDAEYGLRLRRAGYHLYADGDRWKSDRSWLGTWGKPRAFFSTRGDTGTWRRYYNTRNIVFIARRYGGVVAPLYAGAGSGIKGVAALARSRRPVRELLLPIRGLADGVIGRMGRNVDPSEYWA